MTVDVVTNTGASVRQRLFNCGRASGKPFAEVLQYYAIERFLYRLSVSPHAHAFTLKGALLLTAWQAPLSRPTIDIDLLRRTDNAVDGTLLVMREISQSKVIDDGIAFDPASFAGDTILEDADYSGVRIRFIGHLGSARIHMQTDIGFGDVMTPAPEELVYPTILDFPVPTLSGYSRETVIAEKLQALVHLRLLNTRMKDYFDLWLLTQQARFKMDVLALAIQRTFKNRGTQIPVRLGSRLSSATIQPSRRSGARS